MLWQDSRRLARVTTVEPPEVKPGRESAVSPSERSGDALHMLGPRVGPAL